MFHSHHVQHIITCQTADLILSYGITIAIEPAKSERDYISEGWARGCGVVCSALWSPFQRLSCSQISWFQGFCWPISLHDHPSLVLITGDLTGFNKQWTLVRNTPMGFHQYYWENSDLCQSSFWAFFDKIIERSYSYSFKHFNIKSLYKIPSLSKKLLSPNLVRIFFPPWFGEMLGSLLIYINLG